jgi:hypothetical protein
MAAVCPALVVLSAKVGVGRLINPAALVADRIDMSARESD